MTNRPKEPRVRILRLSDYPSVYALWKKTEGIGLSESDTREAIARFLKRNRNLSLVATLGGRIVGTILCGHDGRRGLGRKLVNICLEKLNAEGIPKCNLFLFASNTSGKAFWRRIGWTVRADLRLVQRTTVGACGSCEKSC